jgi:hypothetical protein
MTDINNSDDDDDSGAVTKPEWKKKKVGDDERLTLRIDAIEADKYQARKNKMETSLKRTKPTKNSTKVKQIYDDDEDEDDGIDEHVIRSFRELRLNQSDASNSDTTLIDALAPHEKRMIEQRTNIEITRQQEHAGRLNAMEQANTLARRAGIEKISEAKKTENLQEAIYNPKRIRAETLEKNIAKQVGLKGEIKFHTEGKVVEGVKEIRKLTDNHKVKNVKMQDAHDIGSKSITKSMSQNETAEMILRKSGQSAKLSEIKKQSAYGIKPKDTKVSMKDLQNKKDFELDAPNMQKQIQKEQDDKTYSEKLKSLLQESLRKNNKVRG